MTTWSREKYQAEFLDRFPKWEQLRTTAYGIIRNAIVRRSVEVVQIESRVKFFESAFEKYEHKRYTEPFQECTDFCGLRVIVYLDTDVDRVEATLREIFEIDEVRSIDHRKSTATDSVGYRSLHLICTLGARREELGEYTGLTSIKFEVQVRTLLQHTWAAIEHKRNYKGQQSLPPDLQRRLMVLAGTLELVDQEFAQISRLADEYASRVSRDDAEESSDPLSIVAVKAVLEDEISKLGLDNRLASNPSEAASFALEKLAEFGVHSVRAFRELLRRVDLAWIINCRKAVNVGDAFNGLLFDIMVSDDLPKFLAIYANDNLTMGPSGLDYLSRLTKRDDVRAILSGAGVQVLDGPKYR